MLGGVQDEVVPRSQMQDLWAIIRKRGRDAANKKPPGRSEKAKGAATEEDEEEDEKEKEEVRSGSSKSRSKPTPRAGAGSGSGSNDRKVPPRIVVDGGNTYIEFPNGMHSECASFNALFLFLATYCVCIDDTCVQPGYWSAVAEFVVGLHPKVIPSSPSS